MGSHPSALEVPIFEYMSTIVAFTTSEARIVDIPNIRARHLQYGLGKTGSQYLIAPTNLSSHRRSSRSPWVATSGVTLVIRNVIAACQDISPVQ